jgi:hypothetical protein
MIDHGNIRRLLGKDEIKKLYDHASGKLRLFILLGLNCGYTQIDVSTLSHDMLCLDTGTTVRDRHKTGQPQEHKLWKSTLRLLRQHMTNSSGSSLCLLNKNGTRLVREVINSEGTPYRVDSIACAFSRNRAKCIITDRRGFAVLRKTGADAIAKQYQEMPWLVDLYLAHAEKKMKRYYARTHYDLLHEATDWLGHHFQLYD